MNEVTPQLIAEIATRLFNELPGANQIPKTDSQPLRIYLKSHLAVRGGIG